ncbi:putative mfs multidrug protein [Eutypa lata UCREL1]|uniref:Putative mfs multidrug protein n=1 Tax=Eutypa lata (strain UCR-EL1) TaxID=1287681 RepID=M7STU0_EUTLA|nr:putative mfs multidrug protein [Eutypa lata UCREL1]
MLTVGRAVAGLGSSGLMNGSLTIWTVSVPPARLPSLQGMLVSIGQLGVACGPLLGGALTQYTTWRWCFYLNLPVGAIVAGLLVLTRIPEGTEKAGCHALFSSETVRKLDLFGLAIFVPAAIMFFLALEFGGSRYEWGSAAVVALLCAAGAAFTAFLAWEHRKGDDAMIPFSLLRPFIAIQTLTPRLRIPSALAILIFTQYFGAALFVTVAQSIFNNSMRRTLLQYAPGLDAEEIITGGAASVRSLATGKQLDGVLAAYAVSVDRVMYLAAALGAASFCFGWGLGWTDIRKVHRQNALEVEEENKVLEQKPAMDDLASGSGSTSNVERVG